MRSPLEMEGKGTLHEDILKKLVSSNEELDRWIKGEENVLNGLMSILEGGKDGGVISSLCMNLFLFRCFVFHREI